MNEKKYIVIGTDFGFLFNINILCPNKFNFKVVDYYYDIMNDKRYERLIEDIPSMLREYNKIICIIQASSDIKTNPYYKALKEIDPNSDNSIFVFDQIDSLPNGTDIIDEILYRGKPRKNHFAVTNNEKYISNHPFYKHLSNCGFLALINKLSE